MGFCVAAQGRVAYCRSGFLRIIAGGRRGRLRLVCLAGIRCYLVLILLVGHRTTVPVLRLGASILNLRYCRYILYQYSAPMILVCTVLGGGRK